MENRGLGIILHSDSYDRIYHGFSLCLAALSLGREVKILFTYWALEYLKRDKPKSFSVEELGQEQQEVLEKNKNKGHLIGFRELIQQIKALGGKIYVCTHSMGLLNIARNELIDEVDKSVGLTTWFTETKEYQFIFI
jgi:peroxiredoxin family protein